MAALNKDQFKAIIKSRVILYFVYPPLNSPDPHYFVCISEFPENHEFIFSCCTSRFKTVKNLIERNRFPNSTLVPIFASDPQNPFVVDTYINCNEYFGFTVDELWQKYQIGALAVRGELPIDSFEQILIGFNESSIIEEDLKDCLPNIDDI